jgi:fatty aldehyde-generating acyl-ACP reductase
MPYLRQDPPAFIFLIHPRDRHDLHLAPGASLIRRHSASEEEFQDKMLTLPPTFGGEVTFGFDPIRGEILGVFRMPAQILYPGGRAEIEVAVQIAADRGASVVGLGALTAPATRGGLTLVPKLPRGLTLTTGNALTAAVARANVVEASQATGLGTDAVVAVVGCTGSVGVAAARLLDRLGFRLVLIGRSVTRVRKELGDLQPRASVSGTVTDAAAADIVLLVTGDPSARIAPDLPKPETVVIDLAQPVNIAGSQYPAFASRDVTVAQGGLVHVPGYHCTQEMRLPDRHSVLACLAETYLFAKAGIAEHSVGQATVPLALELEEIAAQHGFQYRPLGFRQAVPAG